ncbi:MAG: hypothetical protein ACRD0K_09995 [Egibacteraceae bacterium]
MSMRDFDALPEFEEEWEGEPAYEFEGDQEYETEEFFGSLASLAKKAMASPTLRNVGLTAAKHALGGLGSLGGALGKGLGGSAGSVLGTSIGAGAGQYLTDLLPDKESDGEWEEEINPIRKVYPDALMEHLGHAASVTDSEEEADAFLGALVPLAMRLGPSLVKAAPQLIRGVAGLTKVLRASPSTRPLIRAVPTIVQRTASGLARQAESGRPATPQQAARLLAQQTARTLSSPRQCVHAYRRSQALDRRFHQGTGLRPGPRYAR